MKLIKSKKALVLLATFVVAIAAAVGAYAYFTTSGNGSGSATVGTDAGFTVTDNGTAIVGMLPGGADQAIKVRVANPATFSQQLNALVVSVATSTGGVWTAQADNSKPACSASDFSVTQPSVSAVVLAKAGDPGDHADYTAQIHMIDSGTNQDNCKGVTVPLYYAAS